MKIYQEFSGPGRGERVLEVPERDKERVEAMSSCELREYMDEREDDVETTQGVSYKWMEAPYVA